MVRGSMRMFYVARQLEKAAKEYNFSLFSCECGKVHDIEDFLRLAAAQLKAGDADPTEHAKYH